jgi:Glycosyl hydrolase family 63 C-terminal domain
VQIADAMNTLGGTGLWDETDGFYYDQIKINGQIIPLKTRSIVGLMPLVAVEVMEEEKIKGLPGFYKRFQWFQQHRKDLQEHISHCVTGVKEDKNRYFLLAIPKKERLVRMLGYMLDENEFLSPFGLRSLSKFHEQHPYVFEAGGIRHQVDYEPAESRTGTFGGNSNWRGPVWFPANFLLIEALERYHHFFGDDLKVECPTGSGKKLTLKEIARELQGRLAKLFLPDQSGDRPCNGGDARYSKDPNWKNYVLFHEYFHGENGKGLGASHQTGWTALAINTIEDLARRRKRQADQAKAKGPK